MLNKLKKGLTSRHIIMIALGSSIGTGFFFGAGESIQLAGPSIILAYLLGGIMMYIIVRALGEMCVAEPNSGSFSFFANKYMGHYAGFISGWNYWFNYIIVCMLELTACGLFMDYWFPESTHWMINLVVMLVFMGINLLNVRIFGEIEFWFAGIKVVAVLCLIVFGLYILGFSPHFGGNQSSVANLWQNGGVFANGAAGFLFSLVIVVFSFGGTELVGITAGETENPKKNIPLAINGIIFRIILFYIATLAIVICLYPWNKLNANISPFVDVFKQIGIPKAATLMNLVAISAALSSLNSGIYGTGRMLHNLGLQGNAPKCMTAVTKNGAPRNAILFSMMCIALTVILNYFYPKHIFNVLLSIATLSAMINWLTILAAHHYFRKNTPTKSTYPLFAYPLTAIIAIIFLVTVSISMVFMPNFRLAILIAPLWLLILSAGYLIKRLR
jgi:AAT family amino acid transporter